MEFMVVLVCLLLQRVLTLEINKPQLRWFIHYTLWLESLCSKLRWWQGLGGVLLLLGIVAIVYGVVIGLLSVLLGVIFTFLFNIGVLWYYLDARALTVENAKQLPLTGIFINRYRSIFAILFWYIAIGPLGVILYAESCRLEQHLKAEQQTDVYFSEEFLQKLVLVRSLMDWIPVRLLGLSYALVGPFRPVFNFWCSRFAELQQDPSLVVDYGMLALSWDPNLALSSTAEQVNEIKALTTRTLLVWLGVIAIFTLGQFISR